MKIGTITQVSGPVVDVAFEAGHLPRHFFLLCSVTCSSRFQRCKGFLFFPCVLVACIS